jgi:hypothetical protein
MHVGSAAMSSSKFPQNADWVHPCPPSDATDASGTVYRAAKSKPFTIDDIKTHAEKGTAKNIKDKCGRCGLSVVLTEEDAELHHVNFPKHGRFVAKAELKREHGVMKVVGGREETHTNVWFLESFPPDKRMSVFFDHREFE